MVFGLSTKNLKKQYESICNEYVTQFCIKQDIEFEGWVNYDVGSVACCGDFIFNFRDIVWDINSNQPKGNIANWYYENSETPEKAINYFSYTKGLRIEDI